MPEKREEEKEEEKEIIIRNNMNELDGIPGDNFRLVGESINPTSGFKISKDTKLY